LYVSGEPERSDEFSGFEFYHWPSMCQIGDPAAGESGLIRHNAKEKKS
jgi:hypothetical protein